MAFKPTPQQEDAIYCSSGTLVSAAAGSGKTAVLVKRVIDKICGKNPVGIDRLLVVTFTKPAAEEMRVRIEKELNQIFAENPDNSYIIEQKIKLRNAKISTIDSFCIELIRENFDRLGISPDFSIADDAIQEPLIKKALATVINEAFESGNEDFKYLLDAISNDFNEGDLEKYIKEIYEFADNMPFPKNWLEDLCKRSNDNAFFDSLKDCVFEYADDLLSTYARNLFDALTVLKTNTKIFDAYKDVLSDDSNNLLVVAGHCKNKDWNKACELVKSFAWKKIGTPRGFGNHPLVVSAREMRNGAKDAVANLGKLFANDESVLKSDFVESYKLINQLLKLTLRFMEVYEGYRKEKNIMTFTDTTHAALALLCKMENGKIVKTDFADEVISRYDEVLVDEFQDTNNMQDLLFSILSNNEKNLFVVGDIKQSIYRFRGANPKNFNDKKQRYVPCTPENKFTKELKKINLASNFRSRDDICDFVNLIFKASMNGKLSSVAYDKDEFLKPEAEYPEKLANSVTVQITNVAAADDKFVGEANAIADYIEGLINSGEQILDDDKLRDIKYSDFTILFRSIKKPGPIYADVLRSRGIPVSMQKADFVTSLEIQFMFSLLRAVENPTQDIPLAAVMMSPVFRFTADEMAGIRMQSRYTSLISAVTNSAVNGNKKCEEFLSTLKKLRNLFSTSSIGEIIDYVYSYTDLLNIVSVLEGGEARRKKLILLQNMAKQYDSNGFPKRVEKFIEHITKMTEKGVSTASSSGNAVNLMTVHGSKGLQFPICILANASETFNTKDSSNSLLISNDLGISFKINDEDAGSRKSLMTRNVISVATRKEQLDEEQRLLYVALTRAKEKLLVCITAKDVLTVPLIHTLPINSTVDLDQYRDTVANMNSFADIILFALMADETMQNYVLSDEIPRNTFTHGKYDVIISNYAAAESDDTSENDGTTDDTFNEEFSKTIRANITEDYKYNSLKEIESKAAVAVIAHKAEEKDYSFTALPAFMYKKGLTPAARGTATHRFMQFADFDNCEKDIAAEIERLYEWEFITQNEKEAIDLAAVNNFFKSNLYSRMKKSLKISREMRFLTEISATDINPQLDAALKDEMVVVQGSVDCVFVEDDGIVVVDFKTDRVDDINLLVTTYAKQLEIYATACEKIFNLPIKEKIIYSFHLSNEVSF